MKKPDDPRYYRPDHDSERREDQILAELSDKVGSVQRPDMTEWTVLADGGSDQWLWAKSKGSLWIFIEIIDLPGYCGEDATTLYIASVDMVDLDEIGDEEQAVALRSRGVETDGVTMVSEQGESVELTGVFMAEACYSYGLKAPIWNGGAGELTGERYGDPGWPDADEESEDFQTLLAESIEQAKGLLEDDEAREEKMSQIVNGIGSTASEYMRGDLWSPLRRIANDPNPSPDQAVIVKMYRKCETTLDGTKIPSDI